MRRVAGVAASIGVVVDKLCAVSEQRARGREAVGELQVGFRWNGVSAYIHSVL